MKILLAADKSDYTKRAAKYLAEHVAMFRDKPEITVLTVHRPIPYPRAEAAAGKANVERYYREECRDALATATKVLDKAGLPYEAAWFLGDPGDVIALQAHKAKADLIVMGSHGEGALANLVLGSVATKVLARSKVPVLVVR